MNLELPAALPPFDTATKVCGFAERRAGILAVPRERDEIMSGLPPVPFIHVLAVERIGNHSMQGTLGHFGLN